MVLGRLGGSDVFKNVQSLPSISLDREKKVIPD